jgi:hypothetical protein
MNKRIKKKVKRLKNAKTIVILGLDIEQAKHLTKNDISCIMRKAKREEKSIHMSRAKFALVKEYKPPRGYSDKTMKNTSYPFVTIIPHNTEKWPMVAIVGADYE